MLLGADCPLRGGWVVMESDFQAMPLQVPQAKVRVPALTGTEPVLELGLQGRHCAGHCY